MNATIKQRLSYNIEKSITTSGIDIDWLAIIEDEDVLPQVVYVLYELASTIDIFRNVGQF